MRVLRLLVALLTVLLTGGIAWASIDGPAQVPVHRAAEENPARGRMVPPLSRGGVGHHDVLMAEPTSRAVGGSSRAAAGKTLSGESVPALPGTLIALLFGTFGLLVVPRRPAVRP